MEFSNIKSFDYNKDFESLKYKEIKAITLYDHALSNEEAETMINYVHIKSKIITKEEFIKSQNKMQLFFELLYQKTKLYVISSEVNLENKPITKEELKKLVIDGCKEIMPRKLLLIPEYSFAIAFDFDLCFPILFFEKIPEFIPDI